MYSFEEFQNRFDDAISKLHGKIIQVPDLAELTELYQDYTALCELFGETTSTDIYVDVTQNGAISVHVQPRYAD